MADQPAGLLRRAVAALNVYDAVSAYTTRERGRDAEWKRAHPDDWELVRRVKELEQRYNG